MPDRHKLTIIWESKIEITIQPHTVVLRRKSNSIGKVLGIAQDTQEYQSNMSNFYSVMIKLDIHLCALKAYLYLPVLIVLSSHKKN